MELDTLRSSSLPDCDADINVKYVTCFEAYRPYFTFVCISLRSVFV